MVEGKSGDWKNQRSSKQIQAVEKSAHVSQQFEQTIGLPLRHVQIRIKFEPDWSKQIARRLIFLGWPRLNRWALRFIDLDFCVVPLNSFAELNEVSFIYQLVRLNVRLREARLTRQAGCSYNKRAIFNTAFSIWCLHCLCLVRVNHYRQVLQVFPRCSFVQVALFSHFT